LNVSDDSLSAPFRLAVVTGDDDDDDDDDEDNVLMGLVVAVGLIACPLNTSLDDLFLLFRRLLRLLRLPPFLIEAMELINCVDGWDVSSSFAPHLNASRVLIVDTHPNEAFWGNRGGVESRLIAYT